MLFAWSLSKGWGFLTVIISPYTVVQVLKYNYLSLQTNTDNKIFTLFIVIINNNLWIVPGSVCEERKHEFTLPFIYNFGVYLHRTMQISVLLFISMVTLLCQSNLMRKNSTLNNKKLVVKTSSLTFYWLALMLLLAQKI